MASPSPSLPPPAPPPKPDYPPLPPTIPADCILGDDDAAFALALPGATCSSPIYSATVSFLCYKSVGEVSDIVASFGVPGGWAYPSYVTVNSSFAEVCRTTCSQHGGHGCPGGAGARADSAVGRCSGWRRHAMRVMDFVCERVGGGWARANDYHRRRL